MGKGLVALLFPVVLAAAGLFILISSHGMPEQVASHFDQAGIVNSVMPRADYLRFMIGITVLVSAAVGYLPNWLLRLPSTSINIPNRDFWLQPEHREATLNYLSKMGFVFGYFVAIFMGYVHWLVVLANRSMPPRLDGDDITLAVIALIAVSGVGLWRLNRRFGTLPPRTVSTRRNELHLDGSNLGNEWDRDLQRMYERETRQRRRSGGR